MCLEKTGYQHAKRRQTEVDKHDLLSVIDCPMLLKEFANFVLCQVASLLGHIPSLRAQEDNSARQRDVPRADKPTERPDY